MQCDICKRNLNDAHVPSRNCGGTCLLCMAESGDPDCQKALFEFTRANDWRPISTLPKEGKVLLGGRFPTNWAWYVTTRHFYGYETETHLRTMLKYFTHWKPVLDEPLE